MSHSYDQKRDRRRKLLKTLAAGSSAAVIAEFMPKKWSAPVVDSVLLPAHAETTGPVEPRCRFVVCRAYPPATFSNGGYTYTQTASPIEAFGGSGSGTFENLQGGDTTNSCNDDQARGPDVAYYEVQIECEGVGNADHQIQVVYGGTTTAGSGSGACDPPNDTDVAPTDGSGMVQFGPPSTGFQCGFYSNNNQNIVATFSFVDTDLNDETCELTITTTPNGSCTD